MHPLPNDNLHLDIEEPSPTDLRKIEIALVEWEKSDLPETRQVARRYRTLMRANSKALAMLEAHP